MLEALSSDRAISLSDGGREGGEPFRAKVAFSSRFVLKLEGAWRVATARWATILVVAAVTFSGQGSILISWSGGRHFGAVSSHVCVSAQPGDPETGSGPLPDDGGVSGSQCH